MTMRGERLTSDRTNEFKTKLNAGFDHLRAKDGFVGRQNFMCCQGCAWAEMSEKMKGLKKKGKKLPTGIVFYHKQDAESLRFGGVYLAFSCGTKDDTAGTIEAGKKIVAAMQAQGLEVEWSGTENDRVLVKLPPLKPMSEFIKDEVERGAAPAVATGAVVAALIEEEKKPADPSKLEAMVAGLEKPTVKLVGQDGNAFAIMGNCFREAKKAGWGPEAIEELKNLMTSGSYDNLLATAMRFFDVE